MLPSIRILLAGLFLCVCADGLQAEAYSIPTSTRLIQGKVALPDRDIKFAVLEGQMLTLRNPDEGYYLGLTPTIVDEDNYEVSFAVFEITERGPDLHMLQRIESVEVAKTGLIGAIAAEIEITKIKESRLTETELAAMQAEMAVPWTHDDGGATRDDGGGNVHSGQCCVTCGTTTSCGCAVSDSCGSCCMGPCC